MTMPQTEAPKPWPADISNIEFERHVRRLFEGKEPSKKPRMMVTGGPSGAGKTTYCYQQMARPEHKNTVLIDWNENMLVHLDGYKADKANGLPMNEVYDRNVQDCIFLTGLLMDAALGASNDALLCKYDLDKEKIAILRKHVKPQPYDVIISTVLSGNYTKNEIWKKNKNYIKTLAVFFAKFDDCLSRVKRRGGWLKDRKAREDMQWYMDEPVVRRNFDAFHQHRIENIREMGKTGTILFFGLPPGQAAPVRMAFQSPGGVAQVLNPSLWEQFINQSQNAALPSSPPTP